MTPKDVVAEIYDIMRRLIEVGLSTQQRYPTSAEIGGHTEIGISGAPSLSMSMKNASYSDIYSFLDEAGAYHIKTVDGALIQMCYRFRKRTLVAHRLCVFPAPHLESYEADPASYEKDALYADIVGKNIVHVPLRFDFDADPASHRDVDHPKSHLTLGQYPNCRVPVTAPLSPARFMKFVLRNFYYTAFVAGELDAIDGSFQFNDTISAGERRITHLVC